MFTTTLVAVAALALPAQPGSAKEPPAILDLARQLNAALADVAEKVCPSVVVISVVQKPGASAEDDEESPYDSIPHELWKYFRRQQDRSLPEKVQGEGSGVIIRADGYILTNGHVVEDAESIKVRLKDGRVFDAKVSGIDPQTDLAVIKIEAKGLPPAKLADSTKTRVGEFAIAIGSPFSLDYTVTIGHVSAKGRSNIIRGYAGRTMDQDYVQTDALINPGNSGGPLLNIEGEVIGINTMIRGLHNGIGFAVSSTLAKDIADKLVAEGKFTRAWLGVEIRAVRDGVATRDQIRAVEDGVVVERIVPGGPAAKSDLGRDDIITAVDGKRVSTTQALRHEIRRKRIGQPVLLDVVRLDAKGNGKALKIKVSPAEWIQPATTLVSANAGALPQADPAELGITTHILTPDLARKYGANTNQGVLVINVAPGTPAASQGIRSGDIVTAVDQHTVTTPQEFQQALRSSDRKKGVALDLVRDGKARSKVIKDEGK